MTRKNPIQTSKSKALGKTPWGVLLFIFSFVLYANTLSHDFVQDDAIVIYDNMFTTQGAAGIPGILTNDTFFGFFKVEGKDKLVSGGRYRPLTLVLFALEYEIAGNNPFLFHLMNVLWYGLLCLLLYKTIYTLLGVSHGEAMIIALVSSFIFAAHPLHTEVVANIKGRDEILSLFGALLSLYSTLKFADSKKKMWLLGASISMFLGCMSKENAITFLAIIPLSLIFFRKSSLPSAVAATAPALLGAFVFIGLRTAVLGFDFGGAPNELMNNPFLKLSTSNGVSTYLPFSFGEKSATILFTLGKYLQLLFFPHPLTHDYYPRHIDIMSWTNPSVWLSGVMYLMLFAMVIVGLVKRDILTYGILFFLITLSIVSNIVFPIGTNMSERFMFMPSVGFALIIAYVIHMAVNKKSKSIHLGIICILLGLYSMKTMSRNSVWKNDFTLFNTDVAISKRSAKLQNAVGGSISTSALTEKDETKKKEMLQKSIAASDKAIKIHPGYSNAYLIKGNSYFHLEDYEKAEATYGQLLKLSPNHGDGTKNLAIAMRENARNLGKTGKVSEALNKLKRADQILPNDLGIIKLLGIGNGVSGNHQEAIRYFEKALTISPDSKELHQNLSKAYSDFGNTDKATYHAQLAQ